MQEVDFGRFIEWLQKIESKPTNTKKDYTVEETTNPELCAKCGGVCCKNCGCHFSPDDFVDISFESLKRELEKGYISIDCIDGEMICRRGFFYILRIRNRDAEIVDFTYIRTPCILHTKTGCKLSYDKRPMGGRFLIPVAYTNSVGQSAIDCHSTYTVEDCCREWEPYQEILSKLVHYFKDKDYPCLL